MRTRGVGAALLVAGGLALSACQTVSYTTGRPGGGRVHEERISYYLAGLVGDHTINLDEICGAAGVARWHNFQTFADGAIGCVTLAIYTPRTISVECVGGGAYRLIEHPELRTTELVAISRLDTSPRGTEGVAR